MSDVVKNLIQYVGISDELPDATALFKQITIEQNYCIPAAKPDVEQIVKVISSLKIKSVSVVKTPVGTSLEGQLLTGWKLIVEGEVLLKIEYVAEVPEQSVHAADAHIPFSSYIVLPANYIAGTAVHAHGLLEDVYVQKMDGRCLFANIAAILTADYC